MFMAIRREDRNPIVEIMEQTPADPDELPVGASSCATTTS